MWVVTVYEGRSDDTGSVLCLVETYRDALETGIDDGRLFSIKEFGNDQA